MLVLLAGARGKDKGHTARRALPLELKGKEVRDLGRAPVAAAGEHIVAEQDIDQRPEVALGRGGRPLGPQLAADALKLVLRIAIQERIAALIRKLLLLALRILAL